MFDDRFVLFQKEAYNRSWTQERGGLMAYYNNRREPVEEIETRIWSCTNEDCVGWMRADYTFDQNPTCPLCNSEMIEETKVLPKITK